MKSNYRRIGDFIELVDERNSDLQITRLLGLTINKVFIESVANTIGTDMQRYKIIRKNQFACSTMQVRRDKKMPIALLKDLDEAIISPAYPVFEIINTEEILPDYLMMWFSRAEFDREACFHAVGGVRGSLEWEDFLNMELPVPSIAKQQAIVKEYQTITHRIALNEQLNQKLEATAQALYKHWFVDFEFPDENGLPYQSNGGEMVWNEELEKEVPLGWEVGTLDNVSKLIDGDRGKNYPNKSQMYDNEGFCLFLNAGNVSKKGFNFSSNSFITKEKDNTLRKGKLKRFDVVLTTRGTVGNIAHYGKNIKYDHIRINSGMIIMRTFEPKHSIYLYFFLNSFYMEKTIKNFLSGSAQPQLPIKDIKRMPILIPNSKIIDRFCIYAEKIQDFVDIQNNNIQELTYLKNILLQKLATV